MKKSTKFTLLGIGFLVLFTVVVSIVLGSIDTAPKLTPEQAKLEQDIAQREAVARQKLADAQKVQAEKDVANLVAWKTTKAGKLCTAHPDWQKDDCDRLVADKVWIGMSYDMVVYLFGKPDRSNVSNYGSGNSYQYCWDSNTPSCFYDRNDDGVIDAFN